MLCLFFFFFIILPSTHGVPNDDVTQVVPGTLALALGFGLDSFLFSSFESDLQAKA